MDNRGERPRLPGCTLPDEEFFRMQISHHFSSSIQNPKPTPKRPTETVSEQADRLESGPDLSSIRKFVRPALSAITGVAVGATVTALAAGGAVTALSVAAPAILLGAAAGIAVGVVGMPKEHGYLAGLGKAFSGGLNGLVGGAGALVGKAGVLGLLAGGASASALAVAGAAVVGVVGVGWAISKVADMLSYR